MLIGHNRSTPVHLFQRALGYSHHSHHTSSCTTHHGLTILVYTDTNNGMPLVPQLAREEVFDLAAIARPFILTLKARITQLVVLFDAWCGNAGRVEV